MRTVRLRMVQTSPVVGDTGNNIDRMLDFVDRRHDVICFPEMCLTGYVTENASEHSMDADSEPVRRLAEAAYENNTTIVFGFPERSEQSICITQAIAAPDGRLELYRKTHLGRFESGWFVPGDGFICTETEKISVGLQLCWESHIPDISTTLRHMGAELILNPHASFKDPGRRTDLWKKYLPARAYDNRVFFAACDMLGDGKGGGMIVLDPDGNIIAENSSADECALDCELDAKLLRRRSPDDESTMAGTDFFLKRRPELYHL